MSFCAWLLPYGPSLRLRGLRRQENGKRLHPKWRCHFCLCGASISPSADRCEACDREDLRRYDYDGSGRSLEWGYCSCNAPGIDQYGDDRVRHGDGSLLMLYGGHCRYCGEYHEERAIRRDEEDWGIFPKQDRRGYDDDL